jgi:outer membrane protein OmpU
MQHKLLLGSTALVSAGLLMSGSARAQEEMRVGGIEVVLGGYTEFLARAATNETLINDQSDRGYDFTMDTEIHVTATATTETGITYGSEVELEAGALPMEADEMDLFFSGGFGRFELGRQDSPVDTMVLDATIISAGTAGVDGDADNFLTAGNILDVGDATKIIYYTPRIAGFQVGASWTPDSGDGVDDERTGNKTGDLENVAQGGINWVGDFGAVNAGLYGIGTWADKERGFEPGSGEGEATAFGGGGLIGFGGLQAAASYGHTDFDQGNEIDFVLLGIAYGFGPANVSFNWEHDWIDGQPFAGSDADINDNDTYVLSADVGVLPGVVLKGDVSYTSDDPFTDNGVGNDAGDDSWAGVLAIQLDY